MECPSFPLLRSLKYGYGLPRRPWSLVTITGPPVDLGGEGERTRSGRSCDFVHPQGPRNTGPSPSCVTDRRLLHLEMSHLTGRTSPSVGPPVELPSVRRRFDPFSSRVDLT